MSRQGPTVTALERAKWSVMWVSKGRIIENFYDYDLSEAIRVYMLAVNAGKKMATLRCTNVAFPPPPKYLDHYVVVRKGKKRYKKLVKPMEEANLRGAWWCPYCMKFRRFRKQSGFRTDDNIYVPQPGLYCPMCGISHWHMNIRKWNPQANLMQFRSQGRKGTGGRRGKRRAK